MGLLSYIKEFCRPSWIKTFFYVKTPPLEAPKYFRDFPTTTGNKCIHCLTCKMICPVPGGIDVVMTEDGWKPQISKGHCVRCGYCVESCPEEVLTCGNLLELRHEQNLVTARKYKIIIDNVKCMGCGDCTTSCPANREIDPNISASGTANSDDLVIRVRNGKNTVQNIDLCKGCKVCMDSCPNGAIHVVRNVEFIQGEDKA